MVAPTIAALAVLAEQEQPGSQIEGAYWRLRDDIIAGVLAPSEKLRIEHLRKTYGFGASALREALSRLVSDGLAECEAQRGYWVSPVTREELNDITSARKVIEVAALPGFTMRGEMAGVRELPDLSLSSARVRSRETRDASISKWRRMAATSDPGVSVSFSR